MLDITIHHNMLIHPAALTDPLTSSPNSKLANRVNATVTNKFTHKMKLSINGYSTHLWLKTLYIIRQGLFQLCSNNLIGIQPHHPLRLNIRMLKSPVKLNGMVDKFIF
ncbi:hypothetical protein VI26_09690 [Chromobacterium sp. LK1]|nr:hypothetical protein VI26_09690 [Chromobacterium sp. LK1]